MTNPIHLLQPSPDLAIVAVVLVSLTVLVSIAPYIGRWVLRLRC